jgi:hypothetical protein
MTYALPASYDAWRLRAPDDDERAHPGPHRHPLCIDRGDFLLDVYGWYDGYGELQSVQIGKLHVKPENVAKALSLLGIEIGGWDDPLDGDTLAELSRDAFEADAEAAAEARGDW